MLSEEPLGPDAPGPATLRRRYERSLGEVVARVGVERAAAETGLPTDRLDALAARERPVAGLTLAEAAAVLALREGAPDAETVRGELCDRLVAGMSNAVLDAAALARSMDVDADAETLREKLRGDREMTLTEYAAARAGVAGGPG